MEIKMNDATNRMTKGERDDLMKLIRSREKVLKSMAAQRSAEMMADFETKISAEHKFAKEEVWTAAVRAVEDAANDAAKSIKARCEELGIPEEFQPTVKWYWDERGDNKWESRRKELRLAAKQQIEALEAKAKAQIEVMGLQAQTEVLANGMSSEAATNFLKGMQSVDQMMPLIDLENVRGASKKPDRGGYLN
jgi:hypothetical protein